MQPGISWPNQVHKGRRGSFTVTTQVIKNNNILRVVQTQAISFFELNVGKGRIRESNWFLKEVNIERVLRFSTNSMIFFQFCTFWRVLFLKEIMTFFKKGRLLHWLKTSLGWLSEVPKEFS